MLSQIEDLLKHLSIPSKKVEEVRKKPQVQKNILDISHATTNFTKMHYSLACIAPKNADVAKVSALVDRGLIRHDNMLRGVIKILETNPTDSEVEDFVARNEFSRDQIESAVESKRGMAKKDVLRELKKEMPYADSRMVMDIVSSVEEPENIHPMDRKRDWLDEGEVSKLSMPGKNTQADEDILQSHLKRTGGRVVTRFPPEPNGDLHIGHAKALNLSFCYAEKHGGYTYLRYDDTNPKNESAEYFDSILEDIRWLGFEPHGITHSSDYFDKMAEFAFDLIKKGKGYVCHCSLEDIRARRRLFQEDRDKGFPDPTILSPYRNRDVEENAREFQKMLDGRYVEGEAVFRFKMDLGSKNPLMLDLVGSRIANATHPLKKRNFVVYPSYEFALCVADSLEDVTHSFCSREFYTRQEPYHWLLQALGIYEPIQWEFSRLNLSNTVLSKRKLTELVRRGMNWDDPRFYTIKGMRRRGFTPTGINNFVQSVGVTFTESIVDVKILENFVREDLNKIAKRVFCVRNPIKLSITNLPKKSVALPVTHEGEQSSVNVDVNKVVYIDGSDFCESPNKDFHRLTKDQAVGLINLGVVRFVEKSGDGIAVQLVDEKPLKFIQWVPSLNHKVSLRLYKPLFNSFNPDEVGFLDDINFESLEICDGYCDPRILGAKSLDRFQFVRQGYFCCDKDSKGEEYVFNLTLPLRNAV